MHLAFRWVFHLGSKHSVTCCFHCAHWQEAEMERRASGNGQAPWECVSRRRESPRCPLLTSPFHVLKLFYLFLLFPKQQLVCPILEINVSFPSGNSFSEFLPVSLSAIHEADVVFFCIYLAFWVSSLMLAASLEVASPCLFRNCVCKILVLFVLLKGIPWHL